VLIDKEELHKVGGVGVYTTRFYHHLNSLGHQAIILRFTKNKPKEKYICRVPYYFAEARSYVFLPSEKTLQIIRDYLIKFNPDIVYTAIGLSPFDFLLPSLVHNRQIPLVGTLHLDFSQNLSAYQLLTKSIILVNLPICKQLDLVQAFSSKLAHFYIDKGIPKEKILVLPNGADHQFYSPGKSSFKKSSGINTGVLLLGRLTLQKNPEVLIKSFLSLDPSVDTKLVLVGHGDLEKQLKKKYHDKRLIFTGAIEDEQKKLDIIRSCQIFVLPSRFEGMPLALLEAMSCGLACVGSDAGANSELLESAGIVIPTAKLADQLPVVLRILLDYPDFTANLGKKARRKVVKFYSQKILFNRLISAFQDTISNYKKRKPLPTKPADLDLIIAKKLKSLWQKAKQLSVDI